MTCKDNDNSEMSQFFFTFFSKKIISRLFARPAQGLTDLSIRPSASPSRPPETSVRTQSPAQPQRARRRACFHSSYYGGGIKKRSGSVKSFQQYDISLQNENDKMTNDHNYLFISVIIFFSRKSAPIFISYNP